MPIWIIVEFLDFGKLCTMIRNSTRKIQNKICVDILGFINENIGGLNEHFTPDIMISFIENIHELRNICAHNNRLLGFQCRADSKYLPTLHQKWKISNINDRKGVYSIFVSMQCFLSKKEFKTLNNTVRRRLNFLNNHLESLDIEEVLTTLEFPNEWLEWPRLLQ